MLKKVLIANRGEIALRIIRACKELGVSTVAVYSKADEDSLHVHIADEAICVGPAMSSHSYLKMDNIISAALNSGCDAIHPGYGFLSENTEFAKKCSENNIKFIGPKPEVISRMGNKSEARKTMIEAGVPVVPGSDGTVDTVDSALELAESMGYPVIIKASSGGGGRGMRIVYSKEELAEKYDTAKAEAVSAFGDGDMYLEKFVENPRHIEFQIIADEHGNVVHLGERDCSMQRRNQKVIEESPCVVIDEKLRKEMGETAVKAAKFVNYQNAGTIEFLLDKNNDYYFIEMNTRIQVEHPVTEMVTGVDLIKEQIKVASGEKLSFSQKEIVINGHAIECRINAEDMKHGFRPSPGKIDIYMVPGGYGVRMDSHVYTGYSVPSYYDSMIGKLIVWGENRVDALRRMERSIDEFVVEGINTNIDFHKLLLNNEKFIKNNIYTTFIEKEIMED
ncbi:MAG: acetyl-CoA carboxylase biotin carboxylase subunit [Firmicutes bacterium]|jgi:acetyl-CoA carboxylase biotin carboxylase subunit|nr:acetyl-CoA carboxylase biotin carboxylase subunit [Bacillota bacterium]